MIHRLSRAKPKPKPKLATRLPKAARSHHAILGGKEEKEAAIREGRDPKMIKARGGVKESTAFTAFCSMPESMQNAIDLHAFLTDSGYKSDPVRLQHWITAGKWKATAERTNQTALQLAEKFAAEFKAQALAPVVDVLQRIEMKGWIKIEESLSKFEVKDAYAFKALADVMLNMSKFRVVQEGGVSDRAGVDVRNMSDDDLMKEIDRLRDGLGVSDSVTDLPVEPEDEFA